MRFLKCPNHQEILEYVSIARELSTFRLIQFKAHFRICADCRTQADEIAKSWQTFFKPEPELTSSVLRVYSRLQSDETLVLKGWKLNDPRLLGGRWRVPFSHSSFARKWAWGGGVFSIAASLAFVFWMPDADDAKLGLNNASAQIAAPKSSTAPFARIRMQDKNRVQVHYVQPELLHTIEFETTNQK